MRRQCRRLVLCAALALPALPAAAQDSHYWNQQYGPLGELLGGVMVGSALDLSSVYYNPGGLAMREDPGFLLSVHAFQGESLDLDVGRADGETLSGGGFSGAPSLIAGSLPLPFLGDQTRLAWSYLTRQRFNLRVLTRLSTERGSLPPDEKFARVAAELLFDQRMSEDWGGLTWSRRLGDRWGIGLTQFVAYRSQRSRYEINAQAVTSDARGNAVLSVDEFDYYHWRTLTKIGLYHERESLSLGLAVTTPSIGLFGNGRSGYTVSVNGDAGENGEPTSVLLENFADDLGAEYRSPLSIALGAAWRRQSSRVHVSAEWFDSVPRYLVVDPLEGGEGIGSSASQALEGVLNFGLGLEHTFESGVDIYAAFATDFSASEGPAFVESEDRLVENVALATWDIFHITAGGGFDVGPNRFTLGVGYAFGSESRDISLLPPAGRDVVIGVPTEGTFKYRRIKFILGYSFGG